MKYSYASLLARALAFATDYIIIGGYVIILFGIGAAIRVVAPAVSSALFSNPMRSQMSGFLVMTLPIVCYFALSESSTRQATWGKRKRGLQVIRTSGERLSRARALGRTLLKFLPWELAHTCVWRVEFDGQESSPLIFLGFVLVWVLVGANIVSVLLSRKKQSLYDILAGSLVVET